MAGMTLYAQGTADTPPIDPRTGLVDMAAYAHIGARDLELIPALPLADLLSGYGRRPPPLPDDEWRDLVAYVVRHAGG